MARIRSIKPEYWKSESIARLPLRCRLTFIALWSYVDDNGVGRDNEQLIAAEIYPLEPDPRDAVNIVREDLALLARESRVIRYTNAGKRYISVTGWSEHQRIDRPNKARYPQANADGSEPLTCDDADPREVHAQPSRNPRATPSSGAGSREQGTEDQGTPTSAAADGEFDTFWAAYPKKEAKGAAVKAFKAATKKADPDTITAGLRAQLPELEKRERKFIPLASSWLNAERWADEVQTAPAGPPDPWARAQWVGES